MKIITCPHCAAQSGFYIKEQVRGVSSPNFTKEGHYATENGHIYDGLEHSGGKLAYCLSCNKSIGKSNQLISGFNESELNIDN